SPTGSTRRALPSAAAPPPGSSTGGSPSPANSPKPADQPCAVTGTPRQRNTNETVSRSARSSVTLASVPFPGLPPGDARSGEGGDGGDGRAGVVVGGGEQDAADHGAGLGQEVGGQGDADRARRAAAGLLQGSQHGVGDRDAGDFVGEVVGLLERAQRRHR